MQYQVDYLWINLTSCLGRYKAVDDVSDLNEYKIRWEEKSCEPELPFEGIPFIILGSQTRSCHQGPQRNKTKQVDFNSANSKKKKRDELVNSFSPTTKRSLKVYVKYPEIGEHTGHLKDELKFSSNDKKTCLEMLKNGKRIIQKMNFLSSRESSSPKKKPRLV
ncbi:hypothetical protein LOTGIDRAFT_155060 [Lottia gigantea]|uniref:Uncharacterized protein n=1 Tax=Lottia gigantea TaxID=225164 RepID=V3ZMN4_LOTGI|nr:hypothetical protein LOTGIDRAFT_155060 [Lottia gigantea]ESO85572.1 hypothetical protein LOTGIDRAFT_155060 [Lottia gigantea]